MYRTFCLIMVVAGALLASTTVGVSQADAFWHHGCWGWGCASYSYCATPCYTACDPCYTSHCGWYVGYRPGPIRRLLFGPYRTYYACYPAYSACDTMVTNDAPAEDEGYNAGSTDQQAADEATRSEPEMAPETPPVEPPGVEPLDIPEPPNDLSEPETPPLSPPTDTLGPPADLDAPSDAGLTPPAATPPGGGLDFNPLGTEPTDGGGVDIDRPSSEPAMPGLEPGEGVIPSFRPSGSDAPATPPAGPLGATRADSGLLTIYVPYDAQVKINGMLTRSTGSRREYVSYGLKPGFSYEYEIQAEVVRDGQVRTDTRTVILSAGDKEAVAFGFNTPTTSNVASAW